MGKLSETEWMTINRLILEIYRIRTIDEFSKRVLEICRGLVPYDKGYFLIYDSEKNSEINFKLCASTDMEHKVFDDYLSEYYEKDYLHNYISLFSEATVYRDTDIMNNELRKKTTFYREFLAPNNIPYGAGCILWHDDKVNGILNFFRGEELGDFTKSDLAILNIINMHLCEKIYQLYFHKKEELDQRRKACFDNFISEEHLSDRERDVARKVYEGLSNEEIANDLCISLSTVKKHVYHIFEKCSVESRTQFREKVDEYIWKNV